MKRYSAYKPSGVEWIGDIPEKWKTMKLKHVLSDYQDGTHASYKRVLSDYPLLSAKNVFEDGIKITDEESTISESDFKSIVSNGFPKQGDVAICCVGTIGRCCLYTLSEPQAFQRSVTFLRTNRKILNNYLVYLMRSDIANPQYIMYAKTSAQSGIYMEALVNFKIAVPPKDEQVAIAAYLDAKCAKIDNVLSVQQKRIELLKELKQSIITNAVTKGLDKNVEFKPSGIEWIGDIPEKWKIKRMRFLCKMNTGDKDTVNREDDGLYPFYVRSPNVERINSYTFDGEAVLMAGDGVGAGKVIHYANGKFDYHQRVYNFHEYKEILTKYAYYYLVSNFRYKIEEGGAKNTVDSVRLPWLKDFPICFPTIKEQEKILSYIERKSTAIDNQISKIERQIELLKEYKQSIITECVTGKRKVC